MEISMNNSSRMPDDVIFWIHGPGETLVLLSLEELKSQLDRGEVPPDLPVYSTSQGQWLPLKSLLIDVTTPALRTNVQSSLFDDHGPNDTRMAGTESVRRSLEHIHQSVHPLRTSEFATRLIAMAIGSFL